jgi:hypothetical protein
MTWAIGLLVGGTFVGGAILVATVVRIVGAWREYGRERARESGEHPERPTP